MTSYNPETYRLLEKLPLEKLQAIAQDLAERCDADLVSQAKPDLIEFICHYGMLP